MTEEIKTAVNGKAEGKKKTRVNKRIKEIKRVCSEINEKEEKSG